MSEKRERERTFFKEKKILDVKFFFAEVRFMKSKDSLQHSLPLEESGSQEEERKV